ncbi:nitroreductase family protein, partial [Bacteroidota bacterium]
MDFKEVIRRRRSIRRFNEKKVSKKLVQKLIEDATYAPTPCNQQLWKFVAIDNQKLKERLVSEARSSTIVKRAPVVLVVCYDAWDEKEAIQASSLAVQNILLSATNNNLGALSMNSFGNEKIIKKLLKIPGNYLINCFVLLGHQSHVYETTPVVTRRTVDEVLYYNQFSSDFSSSCSYDTEDWTKEKLIDYQSYYCRKTFLGKEMDIMDEAEKILVNVK